MQWQITKPISRFVKSKYKHFLFDFDGVIIDSFEACYEVCAALSSGPVTCEEYRRMHDGNIYELVIDDENLQETVRSEVNDENPFFKKLIPTIIGLPPVSGMKDVLVDLAERSQMDVMTSSINSFIEAYLTRNELRHLFKGVYGADVHHSKHVKMQRLMEKCGGDPKSYLLVTDTLGDLREAKKAGVDAVAVSWGFHKPETLMKGDPIKIIDTPEELLSL
jgi:phosphoglycolate phosphatase